MKSWPHHQKKINGTHIGVYNPLDNTVSKNTDLNDLELKFADEILSKNELPNEFINASIEFILGCAIRWFRHFNKFSLSTFPTPEIIQSDYPYHGMIFNLSLTKNNHTKTVNVIESCFKIVQVEFNKWKKSKTSKFDLIWDSQIKKTNQLKSVNDYSNSIDLIKLFCDLALKIALKPIKTSQNSFIYKLNSDDESDVLNYTDIDYRKRTKKSN
jgi:hypothetical protein